MSTKVKLCQLCVAPKQQQQNSQFQTQKQNQLHVFDKIKLEITMTQGYLIAFEGLDRSGKTTQSSELSRFLEAQKLDVLELSFPNRLTPTGNLLTKYLTDNTDKTEPESTWDLSDETLHLLFSANRWEQKGKIEQALNQGQFVVTDRYSHSGIAYSLAKGLDEGWCTNTEVGLPQPDLIFYLQIEPDQAQRRSDYGREKYETIAVQREVERAYNQILVTHKPENWCVLDANQEHTQIHGEVIKELESRGILRHTKRG